MSNLFDGSDKHGRPFIGMDSNGIWIGTENAPMVLGDPDESETGGPDRDPKAPRAWCVNGYVEAVPVVAYILSTRQSRALNYVLGLGAKDVTITGGVRLYSKRFKPYSFPELTEAEHESCDW